MSAGGADATVMIDAGIGKGVGGPGLFGRARFDARRGWGRYFGGGIEIENCRPFRQHFRRLA
jgi:hypothetical protein